MVSDFPVEIPHSWARHENYAFRLLWQSSRHSDEIVVRWRDGEMTGGLLAMCIINAADTFLQMGSGARTIAVLTSSNHPAMLISRYAAHLIGASVVYIRAANPRSDAEMLSHQAQSRIIEETHATVLVVDEPHVDRGRLLTATVSEHVDLTGFGSGCGVRDVVVGAGGTLRLPAIPRYDADARAMVNFTSGSTGQANCLAQSYRTWNAMVYAFPGRTVPDEPSRILAVTPVSHTVGSMVDSVLAAGGSVTLHDGFDAAAVLRDFAQHQITDTYLAVPHLYSLIDHNAIQRANVSTLRRLIYSGTPASPRRIAQAAPFFRDAITQLYGTTEAGGISSLSPLDHREPELLPTVGRPFPWVRVRISDPATGAEMARGQVGEVWARSATVMDGYLGDETLTGDTLKDGWLRTGDLGHWDQYGYLRLVGRVGDVIKSGGQKVFPGAVATALLTHPDVQQAAVFGVEDDDRVEHVHAAVVLRVGTAVTDQELSHHVTVTLNSAHSPTSYSRWAEIPLTAHGKPDMAYLRVRAERNLAVSGTAKRGMAC